MENYKETKLYTRVDTSRLVNLHPNTLVDWEKQGFINPLRTAGKRQLRLYTTEMVEEILKIKDIRSKK